MLSFINYDFYRHGVEDILIITLLEKIERAIRDIDNAMAGCGQELKSPVWLRWLWWYGINCSSQILSSLRQEKQTELF